VLPQHNQPEAAPGDFHGKADQNSQKIIDWSNISAHRKLPVTDRAAQAAGGWEWIAQTAAELVKTC
jgi:hypothetical protein